MKRYYLVGMAILIIPFIWLVLIGLMEFSWMLGHPVRFNRFLIGIALMVIAFLVIIAVPRVQDISMRGLIAVMMGVVSLILCFQVLSSETFESIDIPKQMVLLLLVPVCLFLILIGINETCFGVNHSDQIQSLPHSE